MISCKNTKHFIPLSFYMWTTTFFIVIAMSILCLSVSAQQQSDDQTNDKLLDDFIKSKGFSNPILFDASNIKQFWVDNSVFSDNGFIFIDLSFEKSPLKIQLANIKESFNCRVDVISNTKDVFFDVLNNKLKVISSSSLEEAFINYNIASSTFHLEDTGNLTFFLDFKPSSPVISIKKIVLSFSPNKETLYLSSPGKVTISEGKYNLSSGASVVEEENNSFVLHSSGPNIVFSAKNLFYVADNLFTMSLKVTNVGDNPVNVYSGYAPFTSNLIQINNRVVPFGNSNKILKVISAEENSNKITVDSMPENWKKNCYLVSNAKEDLSDFPNTNYIPGAIVEINQLDNGQAEILLSAPLKEAINPGTKLRVQSPYSSLYIYTKSKKLNPGESADFISSISKDDSFLGYSSKAFCRGTYCVRPLVLLVPVESKQEQTIKISDFSISY